MTKNDIRLRKQRMSSGRIRGYKNFDGLMNRHQRSNRIKRSLQVIAYAILIGIVIAVIYFSAT